MSEHIIYERNVLDLTSLPATKNIKIADKC